MMVISRFQFFFVSNYNVFQITVIYIKRYFKKLFLEFKWRKNKFYKARSYIIDKIYDKNHFHHWISLVNSKKKVCNYSSSFQIKDSFGLYIQFSNLK